MTPDYPQGGKRKKEILACNNYLLYQLTYVWCISLGTDETHYELGVSGQIIFCYLFPVNDIFMRRNGSLYQVLSI